LSADNLALSILDTLVSTGVAAGVIAADFASVPRAFISHHLLGGVALIHTATRFCTSLSRAAISLNSSLTDAGS
jgi:hypothetical protein